MLETILNSDDIEELRSLLVKLVDENSKLIIRSRLVNVNQDVLDMCIEMYKSGDRLTAIKWLIEEVKMGDGYLSIKSANEFFKSIESFSAFIC